MAALMSYVYPSGTSDHTVINILQWSEYLLEPAIVVQFIIVSVVLSFLIPISPIDGKYPQARTEILAVGKFAGICPIIFITGWYLLKGIIWSVLFAMSASFTFSSIIELGMEIIGTFLLVITVFMATLLFIFVPIIFATILSLICIYLPVIVSYTLRERIIAFLP